MGSKNSAKVYDYKYSLDYALCQGPINSVNYVWIKDKRAFCGAVTSRRDLCIDNPKLFGGDTAEGGIGGVIECYLGTDNQASSEALALRMGYGALSDEEVTDTSFHYTQAPAYPGIAHLFFRGTGLERSGFKWGTNNPYLPGVKVSVTRLPRQLDARWAAIRPLNAVYEAGEVPDQQDPSDYQVGTAKAETDASLYPFLKTEMAIWVNGGIFSYNTANWFMDSAPRRLAEYDPVGICEVGYREVGYNQTTQFSQLDEDGNLKELGLVPVESIQTGMAFLRVKSTAILKEVGLLGNISRLINHSLAVEQLADNGFGEPGNRISVTFRTALAGSGGGATWDIPINPETRWVRVALSQNANWIYNRVASEDTVCEIYYPPVSYSHCGLDENLGELPDANPAHIVYELLLDEQERENTDMAQYIDAPQLRTTAKTLFEEGFGISIRQDESVNRQELLKTIAEHVRGAIFINPTTGKWNFRLFRNDYSIDALETVTDLDCKITSGQRRAWSQCISEITVEYTDPQEEKTASVTSHNERGAAITGNRVPETRSFQFIRNSALAQKVADREVAEASYPLWSGTLLMSRKHWKKVPGDVFKLNYVDDDFEIVDMVVRVLNVDLGDLTSRTIRVDVIEDIYSVDHQEYQAPQTPIASGQEFLPTRASRPQYMVPTSLPQALVERYGFEDKIDPEERFFQTMRTVFVGSVDYRLDAVSVFHRDSFSQIQRYLFDIQPTNVIRMPESLNTEVYSYLSQSTVVQVLGDSVRPNALLMISPDIDTEDRRWDETFDTQTELIELVEFDRNTKRWKVKRAVFDTIPRAWPSGSLLWDAESGFEQATYSDANEWDGNPLGLPIKPVFWATTTSGESHSRNPYYWPLPIAHSRRNQFPTRPAGVKINGVGPEPLIITDTATDVEELHITWLDRNREFEEYTAPDWEDVGISVPSEVRYRVIVRDPDNGRIRYPMELITEGQYWIDDLTTDTEITLPVSVLAPRGVAIIEVWAIDVENQRPLLPYMTSLMASQNYVQIDKVALDYQGWDYQFGRNWSGTAII